MSVTIREVAEAAGVSPAAVSKVLHGRGNSIRVSEERAQKIREVAERMAYVPNALARGLRSSRTKTLGLIFENFGDISQGPLYLAQLLGGVGTTLFPNHYRLSILPEVPHEGMIGAIADGYIEGVIWCKLNRSEEIRKLLRQCPIPVVAFNAGRPEPDTKAVFVNCDNERGIELAVEHLWSLGHRRILFVHEVQEWDTPDCILRKESFLQSMQRRGVDAFGDVRSWEWDLYEFQDWYRSNPPHTAVIGWTERAAATILARAAEIGVRCPDQLSVVGFDSTPFCDSVKPRLTAVRQPIFDMAQHASRVLLQLVQGQRPEQSSIVFPCTLDVRDSTAPPTQR